MLKPNIRPNETMTRQNATTVYCTTNQQDSFEVCLIEQTRNNPPSTYCSPIVPSGSVKNNTARWYMTVLFFLLAVAGVTNAQDATRNPSDIYALINSICDISEGHGLSSGCGFRHNERLHKRDGMVQIVERGNVDQNAFDNLDAWAEAFGNKLEPYEDDDNIGIIIADTSYLVTNDTTRANARRGLSKRDGGGTTELDTVGDRVVTGTRSAPYDFGVSSDADCSGIYCSDLGYGGLTGTTDMGRSKGRYLCENRRATSRIRILGDFVSRNSLNYAKETMKAFLEREQTGEYRDVCYNTHHWMSNVWKTVPSAKIRHTLPSGRIDTMTVTVELDFERSNDFDFVCERLLSLLGELPGDGFMGEGLSRLPGCN